MEVSIVIPAFNEEDKIGRDLEAASSFLAKQDVPSEVIVVDDGSGDSTARTAEDTHIHPGAIQIKIIRLEKNRGKGEAVKRGVLESRGKIVIVADSGACVPYINALPVMDRIREDLVDIGLASRRHKKTVIRRNRPPMRRLYSRLFHLAARIFAGLPRGVSDSQCGFKVYRGESARFLFRQCRTTGYLFELEILLRASRSGLRIEEFPVEWTCDLDTRLKPASDARRVLKELFTIKTRARSLNDEKK